MGINREVNFSKYCKKCKYSKADLRDYMLDPNSDAGICNDCLTQPTNEYSEKPVNFTPRKKK